MGEFHWKTGRAGVRGSAWSRNCWCLSVTGNIFCFTSPNLWLFYTGGVRVELVGTAAGVVVLNWPFWRLSAPVGLSVTPLRWALVSS